MNIPTRSAHGLRGALLTALVAGLSFDALAHSMPNHTARIELRDQHIRIRLEVDMLGWLAELNKGKDGATIKMSFLQAQKTLPRAREDLEQLASLLVDDKLSKLQIMGFPNRDTIRMLFTNLAAKPAGHNHGEFSTIYLQGVPLGQQPHSVSLKLPPSLGEVLVSFVQPSATLARAGNKASFEVLRAPVEPTLSKEASASRVKLWLILGGLLFALWAACMLRSRRAS